MKEFWNNRYGEADFAYGETPNAFFKAELEKLPKGKILLPAEGEGRNAVFAAKNGFAADAFDISSAGKEKALSLASKHDVSIHYQVGNLDDILYPIDHFDCLALIFAHFPAPIKSDYHKKLSQYLRSDGIVIFEAFSKIIYRINNNIRP
jgi:hypothetical protein